MIYVILLIETVLFFLVFYRLMTTNHWTIGKKLLVGLTAGILIETTGLMTAMLFSLTPILVIFLKIPKITVSALMVYFFYKKEIHH